LTYEIYCYHRGPAEGYPSSVISRRCQLLRLCNVDGRHVPEDRTCSTYSGMCRHMVWSADVSEGSPTLSGWLIDDGENRFLWKISTHLPDYVTSHPRWQL